MTIDEAHIPLQVRDCIVALLNGYQLELQENHVGMYIHGSIAMGCFNKESSDIDVLVVVKDKLAVETKQHLGQLHLSLAEKYHQNIEISIITSDVLKNFTHPTPYEFHFSNEHLELFAQNQIDFSTEKTDYDLAAHFVITKKFGITLFGPPASESFPAISDHDYFDSMARDTAWSFNNIMKGEETDHCPVPTYAVLNFCRVLAFAQDHVITSKQSGGEWGLAQLPSHHRPIIQEALDEYHLSGSAQEVDVPMLKAFAQYAQGLIEKALSRYDVSHD